MIWQEVNNEEQGEEGYIEAGSDDGYEPAENPFSPVLGGDLPTFAEEELVTAAMPFQVPCRCCSHSSFCLSRFTLHAEAFII